MFSKDCGGSEFNMAGPQFKQLIGNPNDCIHDDYTGADPEIFQIGGGGGG